MKKSGKRVTAVIVAVALILTALAVWFTNRTTDGNSAGNSLQIVSKQEEAYINYCNKYSAADEKIVQTLAEYDSAISSPAVFEEDGHTAVFLDKVTKVGFSVAVPRDATYQISVSYKHAPGKGKGVNIGISVDGEYPYKALESIVLPRKWQNESEIQTDSNGNEIAPSQSEVFEWAVFDAMDSSGVITEPLKIALSKGIHSIVVTRNNEEPVFIDEIILSEPTVSPDYKDYIKENGKNASVSANAQNILIEGESATEKSEKSFVGKAERSSVNVSPSSVFVDKINYIGSSNWSHPGNSISWQFNVNADGYYSLAMNYKQSYVLNGNAYRCLYIDDAVPFNEAKHIPFSYNTEWQAVTIGEKGEPYLFYLKKGEHKLTLSVTLGEMSSISQSLSEQVEILGSIYRKMVMIMGKNPDLNRDYDLFKNIKDLDKTLENSKEVLNALIGSICRLTGKRSDSNTVIISGMMDTVKKMLENPYSTQLYMSDFYDNYCSLGAILSDLTSMPLDIDWIEFVPQNGSVSVKEKGFFDSLAFSSKRFLSTFTESYNNFSAVEEREAENISIWLYWGKDQVQVLNNLIKEDFSLKHNINVDIKITNATLVQALLSENPPDLYLRMANDQVMNMSMREALYDLKNFEDFDSVCKRFADNAVIPYQYQGGTYAIPDTQSFNMMFYRTDLFEEFEMTVPNNWQEFIDISAFLFHNNLQVGMPNTINTFAMFLYQNGGSVYNKDLTKVMFTDNTFVDAFRTYTNFYTEYGFDLTYDFYNRFRTGEMPMAIADYTLYNTFKVSAPEIDGKWLMTDVPGTLVDGELNRTDVAIGTGSCVIAKSKHKDAAWTFLKWWSDRDTQVSFCEECESILGAAARQATANVEALKNLSWSSSDLAALTRQWKHTNTIPQTPGSYYTERMYQQAFLSVVNNDSNIRNTLSKWGELANQEIDRKHKEYNVQ